MPVCDDCGRETKTEAGLVKHRLYKHPPERHGEVYEATKAAVAGASHLTDLDRPVVEVLLKMAAQIDGIDDRPKDAPLDNVTIPTFHRYAESLGLTPTGRLKLDLRPPAEPTQLEKMRMRRDRAAG